MEHVVEGPAQLVGRRGKRLGLAQPRRQPLQQAADAFVLLGAQNGGLAEGSLEPGVARLAVAQAGASAGRLLHGAAQPGVGVELLTRVEALDRVDLQKDGQRWDRPDAGRGLQDGQLGRVVLLCGLLDLRLQASDGGVQRFEQGQVGLDASPDEGVGDVGRDAAALGLVLDVAGDGGQVGLAPGGVDVAVQLGALTDQPESGSEDVAEVKKRERRIRKLIGPSAEPGVAPDRGGTKPKRGPKSPRRRGG